MYEINDGPCDARGATEDGENEDPRKEKDEDVGGPDARVSEPLRVPVQIRRWHRLHVQICHQTEDRLIDTLLTQNPNYTIPDAKVSTFQMLG